MAQVTFPDRIRMRLSRHAKNRMRLLGASYAEIEAIVSGRPHAHDEKGNWIYRGHANALRVNVVVAADDPSFIITVHPKETR